MISGTKKCPKCKEHVLLKNYSKNQANRGAYCKPCMKEYNKQRNKIRQQRKVGYW